MVKAKVYVYQKPFKGLPQNDNFTIIEEELPPLQDREFLAEAVYLSVDPYMRAYAPGIPTGTKGYIGSQVAKIIESKNSGFPVGRHVVGYFGWRSRTVSDGKPSTSGKRKIPAPVLIPILDISVSYFLGVLGMPGSTAYFGFLEICQPKKGETVVVSGAAGAVGSIVGQIAKIKGCTVVGIAGSEEKGKWLVDELGFDHFINYKTTDIDEALTRLVPQGVDCYFDNVGGTTTDIIIQHMNEFGRISLCGAISSYNEEDRKAPLDLFSLVGKQIKMEGFLVHRWLERNNEVIEQHLKWLKEGKLKYKETVTGGFENMVKAFVDMLQGKNVGKAVVKV